MNTGSHEGTRSAPGHAAPRAVLQPRAKIRFNYLNRTNPAGFEASAERAEVERAGYRVARMLEIVRL